MALIRISSPQEVMADSIEQVITSETSSERSSEEEEGKGRGEEIDRVGEERAGEWEEEEKAWEEEEKAGGEGGSKKSEEEVYSLLFCEVDSDGSGLVGVDSLVDYLSHVQLGTRGGPGVEEVFDSEEDVSQLHAVFSA